MKQVIFAIALLAMASLTGCLTDDESTVDETTDTTSDNTGNTNQDGRINPVGNDGGYTPPEYSSVFINFPENIGILRWNCTGPDPTKGEWYPYPYHDESRVYWEYDAAYTELDGYSGNNLPSCEYTAEDFPQNYVSTNNNLVNYSWAGNNINSDLLMDRTDFRGWINKTSDKVTIEGLYNPYHDELIINTTVESVESCFGWSGCVPGNFTNQDLGSPIGDCHSREICHITIFGRDGLHFSTIFTLSHNSVTLNAFETNNTYENVYPYETVVVKEWSYQFYQPLTVTIDLPFEPLMFTITDSNGIETTRLF